jgi:hypothetical protein
MTQPDIDPHVMEHVRGLIRRAFPDVVYSGSITPVDGKTGEDYDEYEALHDALRGKTWSEIQSSFIQGNAYGLVLLTDEAFVAYLPAWLTEGVADRQVSDALVSTFYPDPAKDQGRMNRRMQQMNSAQVEALCAFLALFVQNKFSKSVDDDVRRALDYVSTFRKM